MIRRNRCYQWSTLLETAGYWQLMKKNHLAAASADCLNIVSAKKEKILKWKIALSIFTLLAPANAFGENLGISTYGNLNMYGTPDQIGRALNTLKESRMYSDEIGAWRIHLKKSDFKTEKNALKRLCPDCI